MNFSKRNRHLFKTTWFQFRIYHSQLLSFNQMANSNWIAPDLLLSAERSDVNCIKNQTKPTFVCVIFDVKRNTLCIQWSQDSRYYNLHASLECHLHTYKMILNVFFDLLLFCEVFVFLFRLLFIPTMFASCSACCLFFLLSNRKKRKYYSLDCSFSCRVRVLSISVQSDSLYFALKRFALSEARLADGVHCADDALGAYC